MWYDKRQFKRYMSILVDVREVPYLVNFMHGYLGLCVDNANPFSLGSGQQMAILFMCIVDPKLCLYLTTTSFLSKRRKIGEL